MKYIQFISSTLLVFLMLGTMGAQEAGEGDGNIEAKKLYNEGIEALRKANDDLALNKFHAAVEKDPDLALAYYSLGITYRRKNDFVNAAKNYQMAIQKDPELVGAYTALGLLQLRQGSYVEAINTFKAAAKLDPEEEKAYWGIADAYRRQNDCKTALDYYQKTVEIDMSYIPAWEGYGACLYQLGRYEDAIEALSTAIQNETRESAKADSYLRIGNAHLKLRNYAEAEEAFKNSIAVARNATIRAGAYFGLGEVYRDRGQDKKAIEYFEQASNDRSWRQAALYEIDLIKNSDRYTY